MNRSRRRIACMKDTCNNISSERWRYVRSKWNAEMIPAATLKINNFFSKITQNFEIIFKTKIFNISFSYKTLITKKQRVKMNILQKN